ncbi:MAG: ATP-dependent DNA helicase RecG [candidate division SR1 bacterium]|nr:ATP-dependent DNA helicase RecG [candidate division SR1 bacterium]
MIDLKTALKTTPKYLKILAAEGIVTVKDFLQYFPRAYEDRSTIRNLHELIFNEKGITATKGKIIKKSIFMRGGKRIYTINFVDPIGNKGVITIFNSGFLASKIHEEKRYIIVGKPNISYGKISFSHPDVIETDSPEGEINNEGGIMNDIGTHKEIYNTGRIFPIYPELMGISPGWFAQKMRLLMDKVDTIFTEYLPKEFIDKFNLIGVQETIKEMHYPTSFEKQKEANLRIFFDRLLRIQLYSLINRSSYQLNKTNMEHESIDRNIVKEIMATLPFELTNAQKKVIKHITENIHEPKPMLRLLQGDVGSGKTIVAAISAYYTFKKYQGQSVFLAPLEVLANQHYKTLAKLLLPLGLRVALLTGSLSKGEKDKIKLDLAEGRIHTIVGTHAVIQEDIKFKKLQFVVIDEQHKFGVRQRAFFKRFGAPHILQMSATPIPRSMALAFFGEFDVSIIDEMPIGRKPIITKVISEKEYIKLKPRVLDHIKKGQKVFIVTPLIEESEKLEEVNSATNEFENMKELYPELKGKIGLLHGKMRPQDKEQVMQDFKSGKICLLVSTTVIEVGVDIPEATIMVIKNAERFGLSQLHQLRGRIGRADIQSYCFLETKSKSGDIGKRLKAMEDSNDGFKLAELDLQNRGAGEILGTMQSGESDIPLEILSDLIFLERIQEGAKWLLEKYPKLEGLPGLKKYLEEKMGDVLA